MPSGVDLHGLGAGGLVMSFPSYPHLSSSAHAAFSGIYYAAGNAVSLGNNAYATGTLFAGPLVCTLTGTLTTIGIRLSVNGGAGSVARWGIYTSDPATLLPSVLAVGSAEFAMDAGAGTFKSAAISVAVTSPQLIWLAYICGVSAPTVSQAPTGSGGLIFGFKTDTSVVGSLAVPQAYGALPATFPTINNTHLTNGPPGVLVQYA